MAGSQSTEHTNTSQANPIGAKTTFEMDWKHRFGNPIPAALAKLGKGPFQLLYTRGRRTGETHATPVTLVDHDGVKWLVAPYGAVSWVHNARAAGRVNIRYGRSTQPYVIREATPAESGPVLKKYVSIAGATRPYFWASPDSSAEEFAREAHLHPVFALSPQS